MKNKDLMFYFLETQRMVMLVFYTSHKKRTQVLFSNSENKTFYRTIKVFEAVEGRWQVVNDKPIKEIDRAYIDRFYNKYNKRLSEICVF